MNAALVRRTLSLAIGFKPAAAMFTTLFAAFVAKDGEIAPAGLA